MTNVGLLMAVVHKGRPALRIHPSSFQGFFPRKLLPCTFCKGCLGLAVGKSQLGNFLFYHWLTAIHFQASAGPRHCWQLQLSQWL